LDIPRLPPGELIMRGENRVLLLVSWLHDGGAAVAGSLGDAPMIRGDGGIDQIAAQPSKSPT